MADYTGGKILNPTSSVLKKGTDFVFDNGVILGSAGYLPAIGNMVPGTGGDTSGGTAGVKKTTGQLWPRY